MPNCVVFLCFVVDTAVSELRQTALSGHHTTFFFTIDISYNTTTDVTTTTTTTTTTTMTRTTSLNIYIAITASSELRQTALSGHHSTLVFDVFDILNI